MRDGRLVRADFDGLESNAACLWNSASSLAWTSNILFALSLAARALRPDGVDSSSFALLREARPFAVRIRLEGAGCSGSCSDSESTTAALLVDALGFGLLAAAARFRLVGLGGFGGARCIHNRSAMGKLCEHI